MINKITKIYILFFAAILTLMTVAAYEEVRNHEFINFDDDLYVTDNQRVQAGLTIEGVVWAFSFNESGYFQPLTWLSHMLDCQLYGIDPAGHHLTSLIFHIANSLLLFLFLWRTTGAFYKSAFVAALFALHPINIDTVAWVAERKNLLSTFFWMLSMLSYNRYAKNPKPDRYLLTLILFTLGLMAKPMLVTLPFVLLLLDFWPLKRLKYGQRPEYGQKEPQVLTDKKQHNDVSKLIIEKIPFFALSLGSTWLSISSTQHVKNIVTMDTVPLTLRISNALVSYVSYIGKMIWPFELAVYYPYPESIPLWQVAGAGALLMAATGIFLLSIYRKSYLTVGWLWYLGTLVPVIGVVQGGLWPAIADRWAYVPLVGLFIIMSWGIFDIAQKWQFGKLVTAGIAITVIAGIFISTRVQLQYWENSTVLFEHALAVTKNNYVAQNNLGNALAKEGDLPKAINHYRESIRLKPDHAKAYNNLGIALAKQGKVKDAIRHYSEALGLNSGYAQAYNNLGAALTEQGQIDEAIQNYNRALKLKPDYAEAHNNLGVALKKQGQISEAAEHYYKALRLDPNYAAPHYNLGLAFFQFGKIKKAISHFRKALLINPTYKDARENLKIAQKIQGRLQAGKVPIQGSLKKGSQNL